MLHLLGVLSGGGEPPLCKGRWLAERGGGIVIKQDFIVKQSLSQPSYSAMLRGKFATQTLRLSAPFTQGSLWFVRPESLSAFPDKHCFCGHKSKAPHEAGLVITWMLFDEFQK